jgi:hypothetical protein
VDEIELCKLWNNVQSLSASVETLIGLVNQLLANGRRKRAVSALPSSTLAAMSPLEQQVVSAMSAATTAISSCLAGTCNRTLVGQLTLQVGSLADQMLAVTNLSDTFQTAYQAAKTSMMNVEAMAAAGPQWGGSPAATASIALPISATTGAAAPSLTSAPYSGVSGQCCWQFEYLPLADCIARCQALGL